MCWKKKTKKAENPRDSGSKHRSSHMPSLPCFTIQPKPYKPDSEDETDIHGQKEGKPQLHGSSENTQSLLHNTEDKASNKESTKKTTDSEKGPSPSTYLEKQDAIAYAFASSPTRPNEKLQNQSSPPNGVEPSDEMVTKRNPDQVEPQEFSPPNNTRKPNKLEVE